MLKDLCFILRRISIGVSMILAGSNLHAQGTQNCNNTDPGNNPGDIGCVTFTYQGLQVSYATVRGADGKVWLQQNLGSSGVATSMTDQESYGDLFQWGRWDDGHQLRNSPVTSAPTPNTPAGITTGAYIVGSPAWWAGFAATDTWTAKAPEDVKDNIGADPCKAIGQDWKMPSQADWTLIAAQEGIVNPGTAYDSHLKLPAGGYRGAGTGDFTFVGQRGYFWSSDTSSLGGKYLYIGSTLANPSAGAPRGQGASVRCIKTESALGISDIRAKNHIPEIYPNPTKGILTIKSDIEIENVNIINTVGQKMNIQVSDNRIDMTDFSKGLYMIELKLKNGQSIFKKIIKD